MPFKKGDPNINREGRPLGSTKPKWNNIQDLFELTIEEWNELSALQKVDKGLAMMTIILAKVPTVHLTAEESKANVVDSIERKKQEAMNGISTTDA